MQLGPHCRAAYVKLFFKLSGELMNSTQLPEGQFNKDFPPYIFYAAKNRGGKLEDVMIFVLQNETNVTTTVRAPRGTIELDATNKQFILHLFDARSVTTGEHVDIGSSPDSVINLSLNSNAEQTFKPGLSDMTFWQLRAELADLDAKLGLPPAAATNTAERLAQLKGAAAAAEGFDRADPRGVEPADRLFVRVL